MKLKPYQAETHERMGEGRAIIINYEMGLGKTASAINLAMRRYRKGMKILVVCPAIVRTQWRQEFAAWWPAHPKLGVITHSRSARLKGKQSILDREDSYASDIHVVSYPLVKEFAGTRPNIIIIDELHMCKNGKAKQASIIKELASGADYRIGCTATLMPNMVNDLWNQVDIIYPRMWGRERCGGQPPWAWLTRYCLMENNGYGNAIIGARPENLPELNRQLAALCHTVTRAEVAHLLPPVNSRLIDYNNDSITQWLAELPYPTRPTLIATHYRRTAERIAEEFGGIWCHGALPQEERLARVKDANLCVVTMDSMGTGIDALARYKNVLIAELDWTPATMSQFFGRFVRLSSSYDPVQIDFLARPEEEKMLCSLVRKFGDIQASGVSGESDKNTSCTLNSRSDAFFLAQLAQLIYEPDNPLYEGVEDD